MSTPQVVNVTLPALPQGWSADKDFKAVGTLSAGTQRTVEPVGPHFLAHARRKRHHRTFSEDERIQAQHTVKKTEQEDDDDISENEDPMMLSRDAKDWKSQDHYAVLGLSKHRWRATPDQIKRAHRKKVLRHHPDKKAAMGDRDENDSFFKCIQIAAELLQDPVRRRQFDSVDEACEVDPPSKKEVQKGNFFKLWRPVLKAEGRFSRVQPVPELGDENSTQEHVENFYNFWYNFDSWRTFEYLDEDVPDDNENRDQKRHVEKKNANARRKRKTEDITRLRHMVDDLAGMDERIKNFRKAARAGKDKKRLEKEAEAKRLVEEKERARVEEEERKKAADEAAKADREKNKKAKEAAKNASKKNKRVLKGSVKDANYFAESGAPSAAEVDSVLTDVDLIISKIDAEELAGLAERLTAAGKDIPAVKNVYAEESKRLVGAGKLKEGETKTF
ncbi:ribosome associated DnaJ chaperone Zuotin [Aspergillus campestris IBT 28561]|uniref:Ribosome associated DnaJ chaperone Zuotin n=1 Tax=Aspergillus campestris (strain IBT 28561) TaxID=1392248 RepID=A0A2I1D705_ASPC2|nr:ribosome associated DnaJ chaperone Zuotin [Aspergillus campestris IBT 28561]PKY05670.1 ribosome associated DnaJ chaperone Zuotin [Aspergillus campestris IBT 28561]